MGWEEGRRKRKEGRKDRRKDRRKGGRKEVGMYICMYMYLACNKLSKSVEWALLEKKKAGWIENIHRRLVI